MSDPAPAGAGPVAKLFGALLMAVGGLIALSSGLCSLAVIGTVVMSIVQHPDQSVGAVAGIPVVLLFGGVPFGFGAGVFLWGRVLYRRG